MSLFAHNKGNFDPVTTAAIAAAANKQLAQPVSNNAGNVYKVFLPYSQPPQSNLAPFIQLTVNANSFVILDAPSSIIVKSDIFQETVFQERTGQTFSQNFQFLQMKCNTESLNIPNWTNDNFPASVPDVNGITVTVWAGISNQTGYIDNRTQPARNSYEIIVPTYTGLTAGNFQSVNANSTGTFALGPQTQYNTSGSSDTYYNVNFAQYTLKDLIISNMDQSNNIILVDNYGNYIVNIPANTVMRVPMAVYSGNTYNGLNPLPANPSTFALKNPNGSTVNFISSIVIYTNSVDYSIPY